jgi:hypothetical protein
MLFQVQHVVEPADFQELSLHAFGILGRCLIRYGESTG